MSLPGIMRSVLCGVWSVQILSVLHLFIHLALLNNTPARAYYLYSPTPLHPPPTVYTFPRQQVPPPLHTTQSLSVPPSLPRSPRRMNVCVSFPPAFWRVKSAIYWRQHSSRQQVRREEVEPWNSSTISVVDVGLSPDVPPPVEARVLFLVFDKRYFLF